MVDLRKALSSIRTPSRSNLVLLRNVSAIASVEAMFDSRGALWSKNIEEKCDAASLAIFGITKADTEPPEPHPDSFEGTRSAAHRYTFSEKASESYFLALDAWHEFKEAMRDYEEGIQQVGVVAYWRSRGYDLTDRYRDELRCVPYFHRQLYVAVRGLLPGAQVTTDGSGQRAPQSVEQWEAALMAEAQRFRSIR